MSRTCQQGVYQVQEREQWWWHTILWRSSLGRRRRIRGVQQQRSRTPPGDKGGKSQKPCDRCGRRNSCTGERGTCPAWGKECGICRGKNHYKAVCWKAAQMQAGGGTQPKFQKQGKGKSPGKNGKAKAKHAHSIVVKTVPSAKGIVSGLEEGASASNSVTSEPSLSLSLGVQRVNSILPAGNRQSKASLHTCNVFSWDSIHNTGDGTLDQCQTDTDPSGCLCILADIHVSQECPFNLCVLVVLLRPYSLSYTRP